MSRCSTLPCRRAARRDLEQSASFHMGGPAGGGTAHRLRGATAVRPGAAEICTGTRSGAGAHRGEELGLPTPAHQAGGARSHSARRFRPRLLPRRYRCPCAHRPGDRRAEDQAGRQPARRARLPVDRRGRELPLLLAAGLGHPVTRAVLACTCQQAMADQFSGALLACRLAGDRVPRARTATWRASSQAGFDGVYLDRVDAFEEFESGNRRRASR